MIMQSNIFSNCMESNVGMCIVCQSSGKSGDPCVECIWSHLERKSDGPRCLFSFWLSDSLGSPFCTLSVCCPRLHALYTKVAIKMQMIHRGILIDADDTSKNIA
ncbi:hypothetical protein KP509_15G028400 [Ceratopteris richardii]|uniref:Uncharacterized protein n=1 Tax=Ceratopteris richardii TaxID=49495 RepID=A0A8T2T6S6_CERRI|nr:hypothetical protein KP509_15G028400 [Ceratopteris richardii]